MGEWERGSGRGGENCLELCSRMRKVYKSECSCNTMEVTMNDVMNELKQMRVEIEIIRDTVLDPDALLTVDEEKRLDDSLRRYDKGETFSLGDIEEARRRNA